MTGVAAAFLFFFFISSSDHNSRKVVNWVSGFVFLSFFFFFITSEFSIKGTFLLILVQLKM